VGIADKSGEFLVVDSLRLRKEILHETEL